jgi:hypothetical protein
MHVHSIAFLILVIGLSGISRATNVATRPSPSGPPNAKTTDEIVKAVEPLKGFGCIQSVLFNRWGRQIFAVWYCPFSGRGDCYLHAYYYDYEKAVWIRFIDRLVSTSGDLSPEMPPGNELIFRTNDGTIAVRESVAAFPEKR